MKGAVRQSLFCRDSTDCRVPGGAALVERQEEEAAFRFGFCVREYIRIRA